LLNFEDVTSLKTKGFEDVTSLKNKGFKDVTSLKNKGFEDVTSLKNQEPALNRGPTGERLTSDLAPS
jgi:hypothetical protein